MKAIILAGGFGTRLKHVLPNTPKPMADINGKPFLEVLVKYLEKQGFEEFTLSVHHMRNQIVEYFKNKKNINFAIEENPLGTGGAIINSIKKANLRGNVAVLNGDSFLEIDYNKFFAEHQNKNISLALREVEDTARYGRVEIDNKNIIGFKEKGISGKGLINAGSYIINTNWLLNQNLPESFSFESDFLLPRINEINAGYFIANNYFIDIGIPEDYARAQNELK